MLIFIRYIWYNMSLRNISVGLSAKETFFMSPHIDPFSIGTNLTVLPVARIPTATFPRTMTFRFMYVFLAARTFIVCHVMAHN